MRALLRRVVSQEALTSSVWGFTRENYKPVLAYFRSKLPGCYFNRAVNLSSWFYMLFGSRVATQTYTPAQWGNVLHLSN